MHTTMKGKRVAAFILVLSLLWMTLFALPRTQYELYAEAEVAAAAEQGKFNDGILTYRQLEGLSALAVTGTVKSISGAFSVPEIYNEMSVVAIDGGAFAGCTGLTEISLPDTIQEIGEQAFYGCSALDVINLEKSIRSVGKNAFGNTAWSESHASEPVLILDDIVLISVKDTEVNLTIPETVRVIADSACENNTVLESVRLSAVSGYIGKRSFSGCTALTSVIMPSGVKSVGDYAFSGSGLTAAVLPATVLSVGRGAFKECTALEQVMVWDGLVKLGNSAFAGCTSLKQITLPDSVSEVGASAFKQCSNLRKAVLGQRITAVSDYMFQGCTSLSSVTLGTMIESIGTAAFNKCTSLREVVLPETLVSIGSEAFQSCMSLKNINIPEGVVDVGMNAFFDTAFYNSLRAANSESSFVIYDGSVLLGYYGEDTELTVPEGVRIIGGAAFAANETIDIINLPSTVRCVSSYAFDNLWTMRYINGTENLEYIGVYAFWDCTSLKGLTIPGKVSTIREGTAFGCESLSFICICDGVQVIENEAFSLSGLTAAEFPVSVNRIKSLAFAECDALSQVTVCNEACVLEEKSIPVDVLIYGYKNSTAEAYALENGNDFALIETQPVATATTTSTTITTLPTTTVTTTVQTTVPTTTLTTARPVLQTIGTLAAGEVEVSLLDLAENNYSVKIPISLSDTGGWRNIIYGFAYDKSQLTPEAEELDSELLAAVDSMGGKLVRNPAVNHELGVFWDVIELIDVEDIYCPDGVIAYITVTVSPDVQPGDVCELKLLSENTTGDLQIIRGEKGKGSCELLSGRIIISGESVTGMTSATTVMTITTTTTTTVSGFNTTNATVPLEDRICGDVNGDNFVDMSDANCILRIYAELALDGKGLDERYIRIVDTDGDGVIGVADARLVLKYYSEKSAKLTDLLFEIWRVAQ